MTGVGDGEADDEAAVEEGGAGAARALAASERVAREKSIIVGIWER